jgi:hypothetical protein
MSTMTALTAAGHGESRCVPVSATPGSPATTTTPSALKTGFDPRQLTSAYRYSRIHPQGLQAWRRS